MYCGEVDLVKLKLMIDVFINHSEHGILDLPTIAVSPLTKILNELGYIKAPDAYELDGDIFDIIYYNINNIKEGLLFIGDIMYEGSLLEKIEINYE